MMLQYLSDRMYDEVRGQGLTYGVSLSLSITEGRSTLSLTRSSRLVEAYKVVQEILERFVNDDYEWKDSLVSSAKGSLIYSWTEKEETVEDLVEQTVKAYMRQTDSKYNRWGIYLYNNFSFILRSSTLVVGNKRGTSERLDWICGDREEKEKKLELHV